jgi:hypothetical protein
MKGGCFCGSLRYVLLSKPEDVYYCHCRDCQILSGSAFHVLGIMKRGSIMILSGGLTRYAHSTDSGSEMTREFCPKCGTPLFLKSTRFPEIEMFTASSLEEPDGVQPSFEIWFTSKISWSDIDSELKSFPHGPLDGTA